jgi:hypothetical protein
MSLDKNGLPLKFGIVKGEDTAPKLSIPLAATQYIPAGGCFCKTDGSGRGQVAGDGDTLIMGYIMPNETGLDVGKKYQTTSGTAGAVPFSPWIPAAAMLGCVVRLPVDSGTYVQAMQGQTCDLIIQNGKAQAASLDQSAEDVVVIVDGDLINNKWVDVILNPSKITGQAGVV